MSGGERRHTGFCLLFLILFLVPYPRFVQPVFAGMVGDPIPLGREGWSRLSLEYDQTEQAVESATPRYTGDLRSDRVLLRANYGLSKGIDTFFLLGGGDIEAPNRVFSADFGIAFGGGARWKVLEGQRFSVGVGLQLLNVFSQGGVPVAPKRNLFEVQADLGAAMTSLPFFVPYGGLTLKREEGKFWGAETVRIHSKNWLGLFLGGKFQIWKSFWFSAEGRFVNEYSIGLAVAYRL